MNKLEKYWKSMANEKFMKEQLKLLEEDILETLSHHPHIKFSKEKFREIIVN